MICSVYKSIKKPDSYLYIPFNSSFDELPQALVAMWGEPQLVMHINLSEKDKLALADINEVKKKLIEEGFYLQLPASDKDIARILSEKA